MKSVFFYCAITFSNGKPSAYSSGAVDVEGEISADIFTAMLDKICKDKGLDRNNTILTALNRL